MCVEVTEQVSQEMESLDNNNTTDKKQQPWPLHCELLHTQMENWDKDPTLISSSDGVSVANSFPVRFQFFLTFNSVPSWVFFFFELCQFSWLPVW